MAFHSSLDALLRVRRGSERQQKLLLQAAHRQLSAVQSTLDNVDAQINADAQCELRQMQSGFTAAELHFAELCRATLRARRQTVAGELAKARAAREACAQAFRQAKQQREMLETLRQQQLDAYLQRAARQEQRRLDDLFLLRRAYLSRG